jgi:hypothetical protein
LGYFATSCMIEMEIESPIKYVIINESGHLNIFLEGQNPQIFFNMYFKNLIHVLSLNVLYNVLEQHILLAKT